MVFSCRLITAKCTELLMQRHYILIGLLFLMPLCKVLLRPGLLRRLGHNLCKFVLTWGTLPCHMKMFHSDNHRRNQKASDELFLYTWRRHFYHHHLYMWEGIWFMVNLVSVRLQHIDRHDLQRLSH